ncbi:MAG: DUF481 domain-containing protein [bacterium]
MKNLTICMILLFLYSAAVFATEVSTVLQGTFGLQFIGGINQSSILSTDINYNYNEKWDHEWTFGLQSDFQRIRNEEAISKHMASLRYGRSINKVLYSFTMLDMENDRLRDLDFRQGLAIGLGCWFIDTEDNKLLAEIACGLYSDRSTMEAVKQYYPLQFREDLKTKLADNICFNQEFFFTQLYQGSRYIFDIRIESIISLQWGLAVNANYDLVTYDSGIRQEDTKFLVELIFKFASNFSK